MNYFFYCTARFFSILQLFCALHVFARKSVGMNKILADSFTLFAKKQQVGLAKQPLLHTRTSNFPTALLHVVARGTLDAYTPCMEQSGKIFNSWAHMLEWYSHLCKCDLVCKIANTNWRLSPLHLEISALHVSFGSAYRCSRTALREATFRLLQGPTRIAEPTACHKKSRNDRQMH